MHKHKTLGAEGIVGDDPQHNTNLNYRVMEIKGPKFEPFLDSVVRFSFALNQIPNQSSLLGGLKSVWSGH